MACVPASVATLERVQGDLAANSKAFAMTIFSGADEARVQAMIASDPDAPEAAGPGWPSRIDNALQDAVGLLR